MKKIKLMSSELEWLKGFREWLMEEGLNDDEVMGEVNARLVELMIKEK